MTSNNPKNLSIVSIAAPELEFYSIQNGEKNIYVYHAPYIRLLSQTFQVPYKIILPSDEDEFAEKLPDGNWTGYIGMVQRSEVDIAVNAHMDYETFQDMNFSYPYIFTDVTFVTDKPESNPESLAVTYPFSSALWISLIFTIFLFSCGLFLHVHRKQTYQNILFMTVGSLLEKSIDIRLRKCNLKLIVGAWLMFVFVIINSYMAVLLSVLILPRFTGIRDIPDLAKAAEQNSVTCYSYKGSTLIQNLLQSEYDTWRSVGKCMQRNILNPENVEEAFFRASPKKAFIEARIYLGYYEDMYFISEDSFYNMMFAVSVSKTFRQLRYLNEKIHRLFAAGLFQKIAKDETLFLKLKARSFDSTEPPTRKILQLEDLKGAFIALFIGYGLSIIVLLIEMVIKYLPISKANLTDQRWKNFKKIF